MVFFIGRIILLLLQYKKFSLSKLNFYFEFANNLLIALFLPQNMNLEDALAYTVLTNFVTFLFDFFHWWPSLIASSLLIVAEFAGRSLMYDEPLNQSSNIATCIIIICWQALSLWPIQLCITKVGMIFVEAELLRTGNEQLLNQLDEGVIVLESESKEIVFAN